MKQVKTWSWLFVSVLIIGIFLSLPVSGFAAEENGGAVQTNGVITFYEDTAPSTSSSTSEAPAPSGTYPSTGITKPVGKYPSTGELVKASLGISGIVFVLIALLLFLWKRKKDHKEGEENK